MFAISTLTQYVCTVALHLEASSYSCSNAAAIGQQIGIDHAAAHFAEAALRRCLLRTIHLGQFVDRFVICEILPLGHCSSCR